MMAVEPQTHQMPQENCSGKSICCCCVRLGRWLVPSAALLEFSPMLTCSSFSAGHTPLSELPAAHDLCTHNHLHSFSADTIVYGDPCSRVIRAVASRKKFTRCDLSATSCLFLCLGSFTTVACVVVRVTSLLLYHYR